MAEKYNASFKDGSGKPIDGGRGICPIFAVEENDKIIFLGTGFFITTNGLLITAKHCLQKNNGEGYKSVHIIQFLENNKWIRRNMYKPYFNSSDIAVVVPRMYTDTATGLPIKNIVPTITTRIPAIGEKIASFAYPKTIVNQDYDLKTINVITDTTWHFGEIEDFHPSGISFLNNPCYQSSMHILGGSSGGPVANTDGKVFAINSIGADVADGLEPYSFLTPIANCLDIEIEIDTGEKYSIQKLIDLNQILFEK